MNLNRETPVNRSDPGEGQRAHVQIERIPECSDASTIEMTLVLIQFDEMHRPFGDVGICLQLRPFDVVRFDCKQIRCHSSAPVDLDVATYYAERSPPDCRPTANP